MPDCGDEPDLLPASLVRCGEVPLCSVVHCFRRVKCLIENTTALVLPGCRTPSDDSPYYCICPLKNDPIKFKSFFEMSSISGGPGDNTGSNLLPTVLANAATTTSTTAPTTVKNDGGGLSGGAIAGIIIGVIVGIILIFVIAFFIFRKIKDRRKNHGEYRPQLEETLHAKDLPYLPPPNIEGHLG